MFHCLVVTAFRPHYMQASDEYKEHYLPDFVPQDGYFLRPCAEHWLQCLI